MSFNCPLNAIFKLTSYVLWFTHSLLHLQVSSTWVNSRIFLENTWCDFLSKAVFFNLGSAESQGSASGCEGFHRNRLNLPGTKFATTVLCGCSSIDTWIIAQISTSKANICGKSRCSKEVEKFWSKDHQFPFPSLFWKIFRFSKATQTKIL